MKDCTYLTHTYYIDGICARTRNMNHYNIINNMNNAKTVSLLNIIQGDFFIMTQRISLKIQITFVHFFFLNIILHFVLYFS